MSFRATRRGSDAKRPSKLRHYNHLLNSGIEGNPKLLSAEELQARAWAIVQPFFQQAQQTAWERYKEAINTSLTSQDIKEIVPAAHYGRIDTLFVVEGQQQWGTFDSVTQTVHLHPAAETYDEDLLDRAAIQTVLNGGTVYTVEPEQMPDNSHLTALFRY